MQKYIIKCRGIKPLTLETSSTSTFTIAVEFFLSNPLLEQDQRYVIAFRCLKEVGLPELGETRKFISGRHNLGNVTRTA
jgi:hypothetical protein